jgi:hypothetical protein
MMSLFLMIASEKMWNLSTSKTLAFGDWSPLGYLSHPQVGLILLVFTLFSRQTID